jgi:hypothetical protein
MGGLDISDKNTHMHKCATHPTRDPNDDEQPAASDSGVGFNVILLQ